MMRISCALYGRSWFGVNNANNGLYQVFTGQAGIGIAYNELATNYINKNGYTRYWDEQAKAAYLWNPTYNTFISYDDEQSVTEKAAYIKSKGLGGAMLWEYTQDSSGTLVNALLNELNENPLPVPAVLSVDQNPNTGSYILTAIVPANSGAISVNIYELPFTTPVKTQSIIPNATTNTIVTYAVTSKPAGSYPYLIATVNANGETIGSNITVNVQFPSWFPNTAYKNGDWVTYMDRNYKCIQSHTSQVGWEPPNVPALWQVPGNISAFWLPNTAYQVGDHASYNGFVYKCIQAHTSQVGWEPTNTPALWQVVVL